jgi:glycosyltransferase involved in cell wall biosynthesis
MGHTVEILTLDPPGAPRSKELSVPVTALGRSASGYGYTPDLVPWLARHAGRFDAVVVHGIWQYHSFGVWRALRKSGVPYFVFTHGMLDPWFKRAYPLKHLKKSLYWPWAEYRVLRDARAVIFTCEEERRLARQSFALYRCRERVVSYGTATPAGDPDTQREIFLQQFPALAGKRLVLFLGRLHEKKGCDLLLRAFGQIIMTHPKGEDLRLMVAGPCASPSYRAELAEVAARFCPEGTVTFPGMLSGDLRWGAFHAAEAFALPSHQENFGIAVAEALACGLPVLISKEVNIWREIADDGAGLVAKDDVAGTGSLLRRWFRLGASEREQMRARARSCFARRFELERAAESLTRVIAEATDPPPLSALQFAGVPG